MCAGITVTMPVDPFLDLISVAVATILRSAPASVAFESRYCSENAIDSVSVKVRYALNVEATRDRWFYNCCQGSTSSYGHIS